jgi:hypothetical protein
VFAPFGTAKIGEEFDAHISLFKIIFRIYKK